MTIDVLEIEDDDMVMVTHNIGALSQPEVDDYCSKIIPKLVSIFGEGRVAFFPVREGDTWDFTIIRKV